MRAGDHSVGGAKRPCLAPMFPNGMKHACAGVAVLRRLGAPVFFAFTFVQQVTLPAGIHNILWRRAVPPLGVG